MYTLFFIIAVFITTVVVNIRAEKKEFNKTVAKQNADTRSKISFAIMLIGVFIINISSLGDEPETDDVVSVKDVGDYTTNTQSAVETVAPTSPGASEVTLQPSKEEIEKQFSNWDGSHIKTEEYVKEHMNDPDSYEHVSSQYKIHPDYLEVVMTF